MLFMYVWVVLHIIIFLLQTDIYNYMTATDNIILYFIFKLLTKQISFESKFVHVLFSSTSSITVL